MSETVVPVTEVTAPPAAAPVAPAATPAAVAAPKPAAPAAEAPPPYLQDRLRRERRATLKAAGIDVPKGATDLEIDQAIAASKDKAKSRKDRARAAEQAADAASKDVETLKAQLGAMKIYADAELARLDPKQAELVKTLAGDDPGAQLKQIAALRSMVGEPAPLAAPASTSNNQVSPPPAPPSGGSDVAKKLSEIRAMPRANPKDAARRAVALTMLCLENDVEILSAFTLE